METMETKLYVTLVRNIERFGGRNPFIIGRISGIMFAMCNKYDVERYERSYAMEEDENGTYLRVETTEADYDKFLAECDKIYPGLVELYESYNL